jgi:hypothetical protein
MAAATPPARGRLTIPHAIRERDVRSLKTLLRKPSRPVSIADMKAAVRTHARSRTLIDSPVAVGMSLLS